MCCLYFCFTFSLLLQILLSSLYVVTLKRLLLSCAILLHSKHQLEFLNFTERRSHSKNTSPNSFVQFI